MTIRTLPVRLSIALLAVAGGIGVGTFVDSAGARSNAGATSKADPATNRTITVTGQGSAIATPDMGTITLGVQTKGNDAQAALSANSDKMNAVIAAIKAQGVPSNRIQTSNLSLWYDQERNVYNASHDLTVRVDGVDKVGPVLDAAVAAGANNAWGVQFGLKDESSARSQALQNAVSEARKRADAIAAGLGVTITGVGSASEVSYSSPVRGVAASAPGAVSSTQVQPGELTVTADIQVVYTFG